MIAAWTLYIFIGTASVPAAEIQYFDRLSCEKAAWRFDGQRHEDTTLHAFCVHVRTLGGDK